jgi:hypothetical protein
MHEAGIVNDAREGAAARRALGPVAIAAVATAVVLSAIGTYGDRSASDDHHATSEFLIVCAIIAVGGAVVFGWIVPKMLERSPRGTPALVLAVLGALTVGVFWTGLPPILAVAGGLLGWSGRDAARGAALCRVALVIAVLTVIADAAITASDI